MKKILSVLILLFACGVAIATEDAGWVQYAENSFINTSKKSIAINPSMKQISYYSKLTNLTKTIQGQPVDTIVDLNIVDCSGGIIKTKDISALYYAADKLVYKVNMDKATAWDYLSPDDGYYQNLQTLCSKNFKN